jgi:hypothetical protein
MATNNATNTSNPVTVAQGGTGDSSLTAYAVMCGGTTSTGAVQSIAGVGTSGQVLTSNGAGALPTFQAAPTAGKLVLIQSQTASSSASLTFTTGISSYTQIFVSFYAIQPATNTAIFQMQMSKDGGSTYITTGYLSGLNSTPYNSTTITNNNSTSAWVLTGVETSGDANKTSNGAFYILNANVAANPYISGHSADFDSTSATANINFFGGQGGSTGANAFKFLMSSGNIAAGTVTLYGLATS